MASDNRQNEQSVQEGWFKKLFSRGWRKELFSFSGRIDRVRYIVWSIIAWLLILIPTFLYVLVMSLLFPRSENPLLIIPFLIIFGIGLWMLLALMVKRLHDYDKPATRLAYFLLIVGVVLVVELLVKKGTEGPNQYGEQPS